MTSDIDENGGRGEQLHRTGDAVVPAAVDNNDNVVRYIASVLASKI